MPPLITVEVVGGVAAVVSTVAVAVVIVGLVVIATVVLGADGVALEHRVELRGFLQSGHAVAPPAGGSHAQSAFISYFILKSFNFFLFMIFRLKGPRCVKFHKCT